MKYLAFIALLVGLPFVFVMSDSKKSDVPTAAVDESEESSGKTEFATFGGGCFWCVEAIFEGKPGVTAAVSGYAGGKTENPTYKEICNGDTGHAEVVRVEFSPEKVSFDELLELFWKAHDPTTLNRQGADIGTQYRSVIFYENEEQKAKAEASMKKAAAYFDDPIVTELSPLPTFYEAEAYHQEYYQLNPRAGYCSFVIRPKVEKLRKAGEIE